MLEVDYRKFLLKEFFKFIDNRSLLEISKDEIDFYTVANFSEISFNDFLFIKQCFDYSVKDVYIMSSNYANKKYMSYTSFKEKFF